MNNDLNKRLFKFSQDIFTLTKSFKNQNDTKIIKFQLVKAASFAGANYEKAKIARSKDDFKTRINIALKEMHEANFWLGITNALQIEPDKKGIELEKESLKLKKILSSIISNAA